MTSREGSGGFTTENNHLIHGTVDGYSNHGCRCLNCRNAWTEWRYEWRRQRKYNLGDCTIPGCTIGQYAKGLCQPHYERARKGQPLIVPIRQRASSRGKRRHL